MYEEGEISEDAIKILSDSCDIANDNASIRLRYFDILSSNFTINHLKYYMYFKDYALIGNFIVRIIIQKVYFAYEISTSLLEACEECSHRFHEAFPLNTEHLNSVMNEVKDSIDQAVTYMNEI
eukprot:GHVR01153189.1.p3 GENE.GHVR01153189.1~~GHVR01153189.1.p3  ORF type:complete len:123 (-),score=7.48 GHVR01153189.1:762-1130(-)